ncbi:MAG: DEAD/DEAH box helicase family protein [Succinivibrio sp.]|nr:DEAD/DEAH box helicase family protein [Succinivibrio sp.]
MSDSYEDFLEGLNDPKQPIPNNPLDLFDFLNKESTNNGLRDAQIELLEEWFKNRLEDRDLVLKMHTEEGKTLVGLLMLHFRVLTKGGCCVYLCTNHQLRQQVVTEAAKFNIPCCTVGANEDLPSDFISGKRLLVATFQKLCNGKSKFGIGHEYLKLDAVVVDDAQNSEQLIRNSQTIKISAEEHQALYDSLLDLFYTDLQEQSIQKLYEIKEEHSHLAELYVPYWAWIDKLEQVRALIAPFKEQKDIIFAWSLIKDHLGQCQCHISGSSIEISPYNPSMRDFASFTKAAQRILMTASSQDDSYMVKNLGFATATVANPLRSTHGGYYGERVILIPSAGNGFFDRNTVLRFFLIELSELTTNCNRVALVPSLKKAVSYQTTLPSAVVAYGDSIEDEIEIQKRPETRGRVLVIANRYDGIDLPGDSCRVLLLDCCPVGGSMAERYAMRCLRDSTLSKKKIAQSIEQGMGRSIRANDDYCAVLITGLDLSGFLLSGDGRKYFSAQTQKQLELGDTLMENARKKMNADKKPFEVMRDLISMQLTRNSVWIKQYDSFMNRCCPEPSSEIDELVAEETEAEELFYHEDAEGAARIFERIVSSGAGRLTLEEIGWYKQQMARCLYSHPLRSEESRQIQRSAFRKNVELLTPGLVELKPELQLRTQSEGILKFLDEHRERLSEFKTTMIMDLTPEASSGNFEHAWQLLGNCLGFYSLRPEKLSNKGPDNLWCAAGGLYLLFECKNGVDAQREEITKKESGQMQQHLQWFENTYGASSQVQAFWIHPGKYFASDASALPGLRTVNFTMLEKLRQEIQVFLTEISNIAPSTAQVVSLLKRHRFTADSFAESWSVAVTD